MSEQQPGYVNFYLLCERIADHRNEFCPEFDYFFTEIVRRMHFLTQQFIQREPFGFFLDKLFLINIVHLKICLIN